MTKKALIVIVLIFCCPLVLFSASLFFIAETGTLSEVQEAIKSGAMVDERNSDGWTPLIFAARYTTNVDVLLTLTRAGADVNASDYEGATPLIYAARNNTNAEVLFTLIQAGADTNAKDMSGSTAFDYSKTNSAIKRTKVYWQLNDARYK